MKKILIVIATVLVSITTQAQSLTGKIIDGHEQPIAFANAILMDADSAFITGSVSNDMGMFQIPMSANATLLKVTCIGYQESVLPLTSNQTDAGVILLQDEALLLGEVVVKGNLPTTFIKNSAMVTNVAGSVLEKAGTANDVLARMPGIAQRGEELSVFGRGAPLIYINNREVRDPSELQQLTSDNIKSVEVIANPGARYDKSVKAVVRIRTKKNPDDGFGFGDRANMSYNDELSYMNQFDLIYRQNKIDVTGMLSFADQSMWRNYNAVQKTYLKEYWEQQMLSKQTMNMQQLTGNVALNYAINANHSLGGSYRYNRSPKSNMNMGLQTDIYQDQLLFEKAASNINLNNQSTRHEGNLYYNGKLGTWSIDFNGTLLRNKDNISGYTHEVVTNQQEEATTNEVHTNTDTRNTFYAGKLVLSRPLLGGDLSFGGEYTHTLRTSQYQNAEGIVNNDDSKIKEDLAAAFAEYGHGFGAVTVQAGLRFENVNFNYYQAEVYQEEQSRSYNNLFPSLSVAMPIGDVQAELSYNSGITRPNYDMLRNRVDYVNRYTYETGNPFLRPTLTHCVAIQGAYKWWQLYVDFQRDKDAFISSSEVYSSEDPNIALMSQANAKPYNTMTAMLNATPTIGCWSPQFGIELYKQWYSTEAPGMESGRLALNQLSVAARWRNAIKLPKGFMLSADVNWEGKEDRGNKSSDSVWWADASLYKDLFSQRLTLLLQASDLFNTYHRNSVSYYGKLRMISMNEKISRRSIALTIQFRFNVVKSTYKGTGAGETQKGRL